MEITWKQNMWQDQEKTVQFLVFQNNSEIIYLYMK